MKRVIAALNMPRRIHDFIYQAEFIASCLASDPVYAGASPPLTVLEGDLALLRQAAQNVSTRALGSVAARRAALLKVQMDLDAMRTFVQHLAEASADAGPAIIANAGLSLKNARGPAKGGFVVKPGRVSGTARLIARAEATRASYDWQYSPDKETWLSLESTVQANQDAYGLVTGTLYFFRYRSLTKAGPGYWSQVVSLRVL
jgi:hypothetical protein